MMLIMSINIDIIERELKGSCVGKYCQRVVEFWYLGPSCGLTNVIPGHAGVHEG